ncbi:GntR family transcriptional regulator [Microbacterium oryzae]|uniref:GntR family transcriptional regulator n=1 Tax=Microbacterium oryzae TaxID=743009 RepID=UPI0025B265FB|nr:GntR family transcriptional regulator [Microbacterium oryzae]MDN3312193.1 GntR family transcriptional regulator [Microbacterium oryzae]
MPDAPPKDSASEAIFLALRQQIMSGELEPGSRHSIYSLADALGVSRTPVREAILRLADLHLVTIEKNRGVVVRSVSPEEIAALFEMRFILEDAAVRAAAQARPPHLIAQLEDLQRQMKDALDAADEKSFLQADRAWHAAILDVIGNPWLHRQMGQLRYATPPSADHATPRVLRLTAILSEHDAIEESIGEGAAASASRATMAHLVATARSLLAPDVRDATSPDWPLAAWAGVTHS